MSAAASAHRLLGVLYEQGLPGASELGPRDLIDEVAREAQRVGVRFFVTRDMATLTWKSVGLIAIPSMPTESCTVRMEDLTERIGTSAGPIDNGSARQVMPIGWGFAKSSGNYVNTTRTECISMHRAASEEDGYAIGTIPTFTSLKLYI